MKLYLASYSCFFLTGQPLSSQTAKPTLPIVPCLLSVRKTRKKNQLDSLTRKNLALNSFHCELHHSSSASFITSLKIFLFCCLPVKFDRIRASKMMSKLWLVKTSHLFSLKNASFNNSFYR